MAKKYGWRPRRPIKDLATSTELEAVLMDLAAPVLASAENDPNSEYVESLQLRAFRSGGARGRVSANVTAAPIIGSRVEAKRGTLGRAIGNAGS